MHVLRQDNIGSGDALRHTVVVGRQRLKPTMYRSARISASTGTVQCAPDVPRVSMLVCQSRVVRKQTHNTPGALPECVFVSSHSTHMEALIPFRSDFPSPSTRLPLVHTCAARVKHICVNAGYTMAWMEATSGTNAPTRQRRAIAQVAAPVAYLSPPSAPPSAIAIRHHTVEITRACLCTARHCV